MSNLYRKIYAGDNLFDYYEYTIKQLKAENKKLKQQVDKDIVNTRVQHALKKLRASRKHYKTAKENNTIDYVIDILEGKSDKDILV